MSIPAHEIEVSTRVHEDRPVSSKCSLVETDERAVTLLLSVSHTAIFFKGAAASGEGPCHRLMKAASQSGCKILIIEKASAQVDDDIIMPMQMRHGQSDMAPVEPDLWLPVSTGSQDPDCPALNCDQQHEVCKSIGIPDVALQYFREDCLQSMNLRRGTDLKRTARQPLDLATFNNSGLTTISLTSGSNIGIVAASVAKCDKLTNSPASVATCLDLACMLLTTNHHLHMLDLSCASVGVHGAKTLAAVVISGSSVAQLILGAIPLPVAAMLSRTASRLNPSNIHTYTLDLPGSELTEQDMAFLTEILRTTAAQRAVQAVLIRGSPSVTHSALDDFATAVAGLQHIRSVQTVPKEAMEAITGNLCLSQSQSFPSAAGGSYPTGPFFIMAAAKVLLNVERHVSTNSDTQVDDNTVDGVVQNDNTASCPFNTIDLSGTRGGPYANAQIAAAILQRGVALQLNLNLSCTMPGSAGCQAWANAVFIKLGNSLTALDLSANCLDEASIECLAPMLRACTSATCLSNCRQDV